MIEPIVKTAELFAPLAGVFLVYVAIDGLVAAVRLRRRLARRIGRFVRSRPPALLR